MTTTELELELHLDGESRTTFDASKFSGKDGNESKAEVECLNIDYSSKTVLTSLADDTCVEMFDETLKVNPNSKGHEKLNLDNKERKQNILDDILFDCEITDCALLPRTFWMPCTGMKPRCALEKCALEVFYHHVRKGKGQIQYDPSKSGAEWWVQIRPSPPAGRYKLLVEDSKVKGKTSGDDGEVNESCHKITGEDENERNSICFHWDKDEDLRLMMDGKMYIHPHISTVTYLSDIGAPTMAINYRVNPFTGEYIIPDASDNVEGYISWPKKGKHLSFDGRFLHAAPCNLMKEGLFKQQIEIPDKESLNGENDKNGENGEQKRKVLERRFRRVTFLVNVWLNYKPFNVDTFPDSMIDKLSNTDKVNKASHIMFKNMDACLEHENEHCNASEHKIECDSTLADNAQAPYEEFQWSMGGCDNENDSISMHLPLGKIQEEIGGGNIRLKWEMKEGCNRRIQICKDREQERKKQRVK